MTLYQPPHFAVTEQASLLELMRAHPLAMLVSVAGGKPSFTHLPLEVEPGAAGLRLLGHVAHANSHWQQWSEGASVTAVFRGPDAYISPRWYAARESVPTWNYIVAHAHGRIEVTHDSDAKERILKALIDRHDSAYRAQWDELGAAYREKMKRGIVGVTIDVERIDGKFKLSQNRPREDRARVQTEMRAGGPVAQALGDWMRRLGIGE